ncbi:unnamed protein product [Closterium sp. NIES-54]
MALMIEREYTERSHSVQNRVAQEQEGSAQGWVSQSRLPRFLAQLRHLALLASRGGSALPLTPHRSPPPRLPSRHCTWTSGAPPQSVAHALRGVRLHSDCGGEFSSTHLETFYQVHYAVHQLNLWPSDARPRVTPISLWTGSLGVAADYHVWGSLAHIRAPGANKLSARTRACIFLGFPLETSGWQFYDPVTYQFFSSHDVTFNESVSYYRSHPHRGSETFSPPLFLTTEPPPVAPVAPPPSRFALSGVSHVTPQSFPPQRIVPAVSGGARGAVSEGEVTGAAGAGGVGSGGAGGVGVEVTPVEDMEASSRQPRPASPPCFPSVPQFPLRSSLQSIAAEPGGVLVGGTRGPEGVGGGGAGSGGAGAGGTGTVAPTPRTVRFLTCEQCLLWLEREERERFERAQQQQQQQERESRGGVTAAAGESRGGVSTTAVGAVAAAAGESRGGVTSAVVGAVAVPSRESRGGFTAAPGEGREGVPPAAASAITDTAVEIRGVTTAAGEGSAGIPVAAVGTAAAAAGEGRGGATGVAAGAGTVAVDARGGGAAANATTQPARLSTCTLGSWSPTVPSCSTRAVPFLVPVDSSFSPQSCCVSRAPSVSQFELGFLPVAVPHLCAMLLAPEGDPNAFDIPIPRNHAEAVSGPWASYWIAAEEAKMASYRFTGTYVDAVSPPGTNVVHGM